MSIRDFKLGPTYDNGIGAPTYFPAPGSYGSVEVTGNAKFPLAVAIGVTGGGTPANLTISVDGYGRGTLGFPGVGVPLALGPLVPELDGVAITFSGMPKVGDSFGFTTHEARSGSWDLQIKDGDFQFTESDTPEAVRQECIQVLRSFKGEWFLDKEDGVAYYQDILGKRFRPSVVRSLMTTMLLTVAHVTKVESVLMSYDGSKRELTVDFKVDSDLGIIAGSLAV